MAGVAFVVTEAPRTEFVNPYNMLLGEFEGKARDSVKPDHLIFMPPRP